MVSVVTDPRFAAHQPGEGHPERPERLKGAVGALEALEAAGLRVEKREPRAATGQEVLRVHQEAYYTRFEEARGRTVRFDPDTATSPESVDAALLAAGGLIDLAHDVAKGAEPGLALVRPPGHHATPEKAMGFCLINSVAVAARSLIASGLAERVAIYDWDVHHGNGTQDVFYEDPNVLYMSTHQWPFYPGSGAAREEGEGKGKGTTLNVPLPAGTGDQVIVEANREVLLPKLRDFSPDIILISAGFDPLAVDPLGEFEMTPAGFYELAAFWRDWAESVCDGRILGVLEGGYDVGGLQASVGQVLRAWSGLKPA